MRDHKTYYIISFLLVVLATRSYAQVKDSTRSRYPVVKDSSLPKESVVKDSSTLLQQVTVAGAGKRNSFTGSTPSQSLDRHTLNQLNVLSVGDAAKYFSGVLVKDYGGAGGLKTVSVRSLGASHTGILYDGIPISDAQTGQTDLGRYSSGFIHSLDLYQANTNRLPSTARSFASAALLSMVSRSYQPSTSNKEWFAALRQGSFGFWQASAGVAIPAGTNVSLRLNTELTRSKGNYPLRVENGASSYNSRRLNSGLDAWQTEANLLKQFNDSSTLQVKLFSYNSDRGLPGSIVLYNQRSNQQLKNSEQFVQARYSKIFRRQLSLLLSGKYNYSFTRYTDPDYQNNAGGIDNRYRQSEAYVSAAVAKSFQYLVFSLASDLAYTSLRANIQNFAYPTRTGLWNNAAVVFTRGNWEINGSVLLTTVFDETKTGTASKDRNKLTPTLAVSLRPSIQSPFLLRTFYKEVFRLPSFNDLYYILVGNSSLRPEYARQYNAGLVYTRTYTGPVRSVQFSADGYINTIKDKIVAVPGQNLFVWTMLNLGKVNVKGVDVTAELNGRIGGNLTWFTRIAYTYQQARDITDKSSSTYRDRIPYTPDHSGSGLLSFNWNQWGVGTSLLFSGTRFSIGDNNPFNQLNGWATGDLFITRTIRQKHFRVDLKAELDNFTDERYDVVRSYPMPGRSYRISLTFLNQ